MSTAERLEELRDLPRVTAADRKRYREWWEDAAVDLASCEPQHAMNERLRYREARHFEIVRLRPHVEPPLGAVDSDGLTYDRWRHEWRSLPDYYGPPMRAPSGPCLARSDDLGVPGFATWELVDSGASRPNTLGDWMEHIGFQYENSVMKTLWFEAESQAPGGAFVSHRISWRDPAALQQPVLYTRPSGGGRGWCPKLAGVET